jgi:hypothetical protein
MSTTVNPNSEQGLINYYRKTLKESEEGRENDVKKSRDHEKKQLEKLQDLYKDEIKDRDRESSETIKSMRESANSAFTNEKKKYDSALEEVKDKYEARTASNAYDEYAKNKVDVDKVEKTYKEEVAKLGEQNRVRGNAIEDNYKNEMLKRERQQNDSFRELRKSTNETVSRERKTLEAEIDDLKHKSNYNSKGAIPSVPLEVYKQQLNEIEKGENERRRVGQENFNKMEEKFNQTLVEQGQHQDARVKSLLKDQGKQVSGLQNHIKTLSDQNRMNAKQQSETMKNLTKELYDRSQREIQSISDSSQQLTDKYRAELRNKDETAGQKQIEALQHKENVYGEIVARQNKDNFHQVKTLQDEFQRQLQQVDVSRHKDQVRTEEAMESMAHRQNEERKNALESQAKEYSKTIQNQKAASDSTIDTLQTALKKQRTTQDPSEIPPGAEANLRKEILTEYDKKLNLESSSNKRAYMQMREKFVEQYKDLKDNSEERETQISRKSNLERSIAEAQFLDTVQDTEQRADFKLREQETDHIRESDNIVRKYAKTMEHQRRNYEIMLENQKADADYRMSSFRQEAAMTSKTATRAFNARQNEIIRDYEKKLADQRMENDFKINELKAQAQIDIREVEKKSKQDLELQAKNYEQRIAQLEAQNQERERYLSQNFKDELDRTKRSYELVSKKKS